MSLLPRAQKSPASTHVLGGEVVLAASCDFRIGADDTTLHLPEVELGVPLPWGGTPLLIGEMGAAPRA